MRKLIILMCTICFVLMSACQDQSGFVQDVRPNGMESLRHSMITEQLPMVMTEEQLAEAFSQLLDRLFQEIGTLSTTEIDLIAQGEEEGIALVLAQLEQFPDLAGLVDVVHLSLLDLVEETSQEYSLQLVQNLAIAYMEAVIMSHDDGIADLDRNECFDALQIDQLEAYAVFLGCMASTWETVIGPVICTGSLIAATYTNLKKFRDCVGRKSGY